MTMINRMSRGEPVDVPRWYRRSMRNVAFENGWSQRKIGPADWFARGNTIVVVHYNSESVYRSDLIRYAEIKTECLGTEFLYGKREMYEVWDMLTSENPQ